MTNGRHQGGEQAGARRHPEVGAIKLAMISGAALALVVGWSALSRDDRTSGTAASLSPSSGDQQSLLVPPVMVVIGGQGPGTQQPAPLPPAMTPTISGQTSDIPQFTPVPPVRTRSSR